jgi:hypothetical protein
MTYTKKSVVAVAVQTQLERRKECGFFFLFFFHHTLFLHQPPHTLLYTMSDNHDTVAVVMIPSHTPLFLLLCFIFVAFLEHMSCSFLELFFYVFPWVAPSQVWNEEPTKYQSRNCQVSWTTALFQKKRNSNRMDRIVMPTAFFTPDG